ncbi:MAG: hypothetical protein P8P88_09505 [Polaribacter sp.]|nr:hypothetical protein [Polaribacter sp.]
MKKIILFILVFTCITSCSSVKNTQQAINDGNYQKAIDIAISNLKKNKFKKGNQPYVLMLEDAYVKANKRDVDQIKFLIKENNPDKIESIYGLYEGLKSRQEIIKPLLPLYISELKREANFNFRDYDNEIITYKNKLSDYLYAKVNKLFNDDNKFSYREAYDDLNFLEKINPNFKDVRNLINLARERGLDYVIVTVKNQTQKFVPKRLRKDLLNFDTYGLNDLWTVYHGVRNQNINYDYALELNLRSIQVSPEQIREKEIIENKEIKDGYTFLLDDNGDYVLDKNGNKIKVDKMVNVRCRIYQFLQFKTVKVVGQVKYIDNYTKQIINTYPIASQFDFQHTYANYKGDKRAIEDEFIDLIELSRVPFPTNEQMIYDSGEDLKQKLKYIIVHNKFRN